MVQCEERDEVRVKKLREKRKERGERENKR